MLCTYIRVLECVRSSKQNPRILGLTFMGHLFKRQPAWLYKIVSHSLLKEVLKLLKVKPQVFRWAYPILLYSGVHYLKLIILII